MKIQPDFRELACSECANGAALDFDFTMAFQPIFNTTTRKVFAQEALARGLNNEPAAAVFKHVNDSNRYRFDQACRVKAVQLAAELGVDCNLSINFLPNAIYQPALCIRTTLSAAETYNFPIDKIIFEFTEAERIDDTEHLRDIVEHYQLRGFMTAIDDFGAGYAGLNLLADIHTNILKLDMALIRGIEADKRRQAIVKGTLTVCAELGINVVAEGVETIDELTVLQSFGVELFQGYYLARPAFRALAPIRPDLL